MKKGLFTAICILLAVCCTLSGCNSNEKKEKAAEVVSSEMQQSPATEPTEKCIHIDTEEFNEKVFNINADAEKYLGDKPAIIDFYADWCGPCRQLAPTLESIAAKYSGKIYVYKVNIDNSPELAQHFNITRIPTVMFVSAEGKTNTTLGVMDQREFESKITEFLGVR